MAIIDEGELRMARAGEASLRELLEGPKQYQVPLYQRTYSWQQAKLLRLWDDVVRPAAERAEMHQPRIL
jgi:uncharacterized protein with ParB-like and HNH nuclease domain